MAAVLVLERKSVHVAKIISELRDLVINRMRSTCRDGSLSIPTVST
jgi:hypothetical protein